MRWLLCTVIGLGLATAGLVAFEYGLFQMLQVGTCASGGPYQSARECPDDIEVYFFALFLGVLVSLVGAGVYAARGRAPGVDEGSLAGGMRVAGTGLAAWGVFFTLTGAVALWAVYGPDADPGPGGETGGLIVGIVFILMGVPGLVMWAGAALGGRKAARKVEDAASGGGAPTTTIAGLGSLSSAAAGPKPETPPSTSPWPSDPARPTPPPDPPRPPSAAADGDAVEQLQRLAELRDKGVLSQAEFETAKARVLADL